MDETVLATAVVKMMQSVPTHSVIAHVNLDGLVLTVIYLVISACLVLIVNRNVSVRTGQHATL